MLTIVLKNKLIQQPIKLNYSKLWSEPAKFYNSDKWFKDKLFHSYLRKYKTGNNFPTVNGFYNGTPENLMKTLGTFVTINSTKLKEK